MDFQLFRFNWHFGLTESKSTEQRANRRY
uniref:Uncharacterized protein n=1 Tax=Anguilla anguilla TaxID=7936 RepID=A0A0E9SC03_ANGAN